MSDYYRGSSSYEEAVKNQLNALEATGRAIRKMDSGVKNEIQATTDAINANTNAIQDMAMGIRNDIRDSAYAIVASQAMLAKTLNQGFNALDDTLNLGFSMMNSKMDIVADRVCAKLDEIHDIVNNPLLTQSRELFRRALNNYNRGYYEEALEDCKAAVEKNKTDFISWDLLGHIYMFGAGKFSNVVDVDKAEDAFFNAAKYIDYDLGKSDEANTLGSEIYYYLGYAHLIKSNDLLIEKKKKESIKKLQEAEKASAEAYRLSDKNLIAMYEHAKELHFLDKNEEALQLIEKLIRVDKNFALKASTDKNFESLWEQIDALILRLRDELVSAISKKIKEFESQAKSKYNELKTAADNVIFWTEKENKDFDDFCKENITWDAFDGEDHTIKWKNQEDFDNLAKEIGINKFGLKEENFYNHGKSSGETIYFSIGIFNPETLEDSKKRLSDLKVEIDKKIKEIDSLILSYNSVVKEDYFSVLEKFNEMNGELNFIEENHKFFWGAENSSIGFIPDVLEDLQHDEIRMQICLATQKEWEKREEEEHQRKEKEEQREIEEWEKKARIGTKIALFSLIFSLVGFAAQWALLLPLERYIGVLSVNMSKKNLLLIFAETIFKGFDGSSVFVAGIASLIGGGFAIASASASGAGGRFWGGLFWGASSVLAFHSSHPVIGVINLIVAFIALILFLEEGSLDKDFKRHIALSILSAIFFSYQYMLQENWHPFWAGVLFLVASGFGLFSGVFGCILWLIGAVFLFSTGHGFLGFLAIIVAIGAFKLRNYED